MARLRRDCIVQLTALVALAWAPAALAQELADAGPAGLYDRPVLVVDAGMHTARINGADVDAKGVYAVTGSGDRTVRIWSVSDGKLLQTIRVPVGPGNIGKVLAAISPEGNLVAAGGWTRIRLEDQQEQIYLFDRQTGAMVRRLEGLPNVLYGLTFSPDGRYLAAMLFGGNGLRIYDREEDWLEVFRDTDYGGDSIGAAFAADGRLATTSYDGSVRLYHYDAGYRLKASVQRPGSEPVGIAFSPDGKRLAVGYDGAPRVAVLHGASLEVLSEPDTTGIDNGNLGSVAWSADGKTLFAGGQYQHDGFNPVVAWSEAGSGERREFRASRSTIISLVALAGGDLLVASTDPYLGVLASNGVERWAKGSPKADFRAQRDTLAVAADGSVIDFGYELGGGAPARFDLNALDLHPDPSDDSVTTEPEQATLPIENWDGYTGPTLGSKPLSLVPYETSRSLAIHPDGARFVLGAEWNLRAFDAAGEQLWRRAAPGDVWAVNITGDGRLVVAAYADGTIRWHRMDDGEELLAFFPLTDRTNWVAWTPQGVYAATPGAHGVLRWHVNRGWDAPGEDVPVSDIPEQLRPDVLPLVLQQMDYITALGLAEDSKIRRAVQLRTNSAVPPGTQLHVLAIGVGDYNEEQAKHLRLEFADEDAWDVASALLNTQGSLYAKVNPQVLRNGEATRAGIFDALEVMYDAMQQDDVAVVHFSGHGALVGGALYLLPHEVDARTGSRIRGSAMEIGDLRTELLRLAERGRVLVLLDACRSGAITEDGADTTIDASQLRNALAAANVTVLTSSRGQENSIEHRNWQNGAFTEVFLEALGREADGDRNGVVSMTELTRYVTAGVPRLVHAVDPKREQTPGVEMRFEHTIFAAGL